MASPESVGNLRVVLDDLSMDRVGSVGQDHDYHVALLRRLDLNTVQRNVTTTDDAVRVITPEEWTLANQARLAAEERDRELAAMRDHLEDLRSRDDDLRSKVENLQRELEASRRMEEETVTLELVGVREETVPETAPEPETLMEFESDEEEPAWEDSAQEEPTQEEPAWEAPAIATGGAGPEAVAWEEMDARPDWRTEEATVPAEPADAEPAWGTDPEPTAVEAPESAWETEPEPPRPVRAPQSSPGSARVEDEIGKIEDEIRRIEEELALIASQERELEGRGTPEPEEAPPGDEPGEPYRAHGYTLFAKDITNPDGSTRPFYFFSKETEREDAEPSPLPADQEVGVNARTGMPYLKRKKKGGKKSSKRSRRGR